MPLVAGKSHLIDLAAPEATNRHRHWEVPFHNVLNYPLASVRVKYASFARPHANCSPFGVGLASVGARSP
jgi:hypothetical protein